MAVRVAARFRVTGHVQGVGFRAATAREARSLGMDGHARNLDDGSVEVLLAGSPDAVLQLREWLAHGPPGARVAQVAQEEVDVDGVPFGFWVR